MFLAISSGKRRALIPPSVGYINENLKPVPEEVDFFFSLKVYWIHLILLSWLYFASSYYINWFMLWQCPWIGCSLALVEAFLLMQMSLWYLRCSSWKSYEFFFVIYTYFVMKLESFFLLNLYPMGLLFFWRCSLVYQDPFLFFAKDFSLDLLCKSGYFWHILYEIH